MLLNMLFIVSLNFLKNIIRYMSIYYFGKNQQYILNLFIEQREYIYISNGYKEQDKPSTLYNETEYNDDEIEEKVWKVEEIDFLKNKYEELKEINTREEMYIYINIFNNYYN